jgi:periplasmic divalent cation tolerance protein
VQTVPNATVRHRPRDAATDLARRLVDERLAACVNVADCTSTYRWDGAVHEDAEAILLAKTTDDRYDELAIRVVEWHPHDVPCVERIDTVDAHAPFAAWCAGAVADATVQTGHGTGRWPSDARTRSRPESIPVHHRSDASASSVPSMCVPSVT